MPYINVETEVLVELEEFETDDLIEELKMRGYQSYKDGLYPEVVENPLQRLYELKRVNDPKFDEAFAEYIWNTLGKVL